ncbi:MAG: SOS response-associated peptidase [Crocinitomicaceae bacterium]|jgi:putative SOS response-associated peptidase YedK|nr:SOS response-associated peptidase [Crocinitomicaceae bacterium]MDP4723930.1 SOS response-associated peptidase [Crocinitomicaceae bacterium]MDP4740152.1 SOS response-associated peptidase [Crocinitomicaceae bacterium]MDP4799996.1 SOS response-associated peptidase [Crocinitomicaceae bacterium]MDP4806930.1 SOS response-associated peptidase [Crocinitomicaceae bacterium]
MCYSNSSTSTTQQLAERYSKLVPGKPIELNYYFASGFQFPNWHVVTNDAVLQQMRWGLLPNWYRGSNWLDFAAKTLNARLETCTEKASFRHLVQSNRCLIPSTGFFEWQSKGKLKIPYFIKAINQPVFSIAGLYDTWFNTSTGAQEKTFTILTTEAIALMAEIHNTKQRMPLVLAPNEESGWLNGALALQDVSNRANIELEAWEVEKKLILGPSANSLQVSQRYCNNLAVQKGLFD